VAVAAAVAVVAAAVKAEVGVAVAKVAEAAKVVAAADVAVPVEAAKVVPVEAATRSAVTVAAIKKARAVPS
jgi:hypothetical protein